MKKTVAIALTLGLILGTVGTVAETVKVTANTQRVVVCGPDDPEVPEPL